MPRKYRKDLATFLRSVIRVSSQLRGLSGRMIEVIHNLEVVIRAENEITIKGWCVRSGEIYVTLELPVSKIDLIQEQGWIEGTFPNCNISGNLVEIPFSSL